jgi:hypothetical protein
LRTDSLPVLSHLLNGWGASKFQGGSFLRSYAAFLHRCGGRGYKILQRHSEGDFHPWQSIAYAVMAGVRSDAAIEEGFPTLRSIAARSLDLGTDDPAELGHFLFAIGPLRFRASGLEIQFGRQERRLEEVVKLAILEHLSGSFAVCRKMHLTEGICSASRLFAAFNGYRPIAQEFLNTQLDMLVLLSTALYLSSDCRHRQGSTQSRERIQHALAVGDVFENHVFYVGHLLELAGFARVLGYEVSPLHRSTLAYAANWIAKRIPIALTKSDFIECIYQYGHFRRGISLWQATLDPKTSNEFTSWPHRLLSAYTIDFDREIVGYNGESTVDSSFLSDFTFVEKTNHSSSILHEILKQRRAYGAKKMVPSGRFSHFRRLRPNGWPRSLHYEILIEGNRPSLEIHLESDEVAFVGAYLQKNVDRLSSAFPGCAVHWDERWWGKGRGRIRVIHPNLSHPLDVSNDLSKLIDLTFPQLDAFARTVRY